MMNYLNAGLVELEEELESVARTYESLCARKLDLDLTRGKPSPEQLALAEELDGILDGNYSAEDGGDLRNYGVPRGIPEARRLFGSMLGLPAEQTLVCGNSSLTIMYQLVEFELNFGSGGSGTSWRNTGESISFVCPVPGYDRHFSICEHLGINMLTVPMTDTGPDMDAVEDLVRTNQDIRGIWCVPRFSNPTGATYDSATVRRLAELPKSAGPEFKIFWDNAYAVHALDAEAPHPPSLAEALNAAGTQDNAWLIGSTSKMTLAGAGVAFTGSSDRNVDAFATHLGFQSICPDKVNQRRQVLFLKDLATIEARMARQAELLCPKFSRVETTLHDELSGSGLATWSSPRGGYFVSVDVMPGLAGQVIELAKTAGVKLTPAGSTFPYGSDPNDSNIRLAPTFPGLDELKTAMEVFTTCVKLASVRQLISRHHHEL